MTKNHIDFYEQYNGTEWMTDGVVYNNGDRGWDIHTRDFWAVGEPSIAHALINEHIRRKLEEYHLYVFTCFGIRCGGVLTEPNKFGFQTFTEKDGVDNHYFDTYHEALFAAVEWVERNKR